LVPLSECHHEEEQRREEEGDCGEDEPQPEGRNEGRTGEGRRDLLVVGEVDLKSKVFWLFESVLEGSREGGDRHLAVEVAVDHQQLIQRGGVWND
jgi:hypothetical protein